MSKWYPSANSWEDHSDYKVKYKVDPYDGYTDILYARSGLSDREADTEHIHVYKLARAEQGCTYKDSNGRYHDLSDGDIERIINGANPLF